MLIILVLTLPVLIASFSFVISDDSYGLVDVVVLCSIHVLWHGRRAALPWDNVVWLYTQFSLTTPSVPNYKAF